MADESGLLARWRLALAASRDPDLTRADWGCLMAILDRMDVTGTAWPGLGKIAKDAGTGRATAVRSVNRLVAAGYLDRCSGDRTKSNRYRLGRRIDDPRLTAEPRCADEPSVSDETGVGARMSLDLGSPVSLEPASLNLPIEPTHDQPGPVSRFDEFWKRYPRREAKAKALEVWAKKKLDRYADAILANLQARADAGQWTDPKFIPHATTYLNQRRWEDELPRSLTTAPPVGRLPRETNAEAINAESMRRMGIKL